MPGRIRDERIKPLGKSAPQPTPLRSVVTPLWASFGSTHAVSLTLPVADRNLPLRAYEFETTPGPFA